MELQSVPRAEDSLNEMLPLYDPESEEIIATAPFAAMYLLNKEERKWDKLDCEGVLYLYRTVTEPHYCLFLLNGLNTTHLRQPINRHFRMESSKPYLIFRNDLGVIFSFWFHADGHYNRMHDEIKNIIYDINLRALCKANCTKRRPMRKCVDLETLLSISNGENQNETDSSSSVVNFFKNAGKILNKKLEPVPVPAIRQEASYFNNQVIRKLSHYPEYKVESIEQSVFSIQSRN